MSRAADHRFNERIETQRTQRTRYDVAGQFLCVLSDLCVFFVESISGCMTYAFAARPAGTLFCPNFSAFASFELRARSRQALFVSTFWLQPFACPEKSSQRAKIPMDCSAEKKDKSRRAFSLRPPRSLRFNFSVQIRLHSRALLRSFESGPSFTICVGRCPCCVPAGRDASDRSVPVA